MTQTKKQTKTYPGKIKNKNKYYKYKSFIKANIKFFMGQALSPYCGRLSRSSFRG